MQEFKFGYIGAFTIHAENEDKALRKLIDHLGQFPDGELNMGRRIKNEKTYDMIEELDFSDELKRLAKEKFGGEVIQINPGSNHFINVFDLAKYKQVEDTNLFNRLSEINMEFADFHISGYTSSLLEKERDEIWSELKTRGYKKEDIQC